ncbi:hypothetical protein RI129_001710 [Pyrocoelia pectoralis]|uniref:MADF domain-containing protein n=1 Tax=Pyrocoelia pectoralis TaxID=417401 RepID=A0AAN7VUG6_9COLE
MSVRKRNRILEEFIEIYKSEPCLWRIKSKEYHDRDVREAACDRLVTKLKEIEPDANKSSVRGTKVVILRSVRLYGDHDVPGTSSSNQSNHVIFRNWDGLKSVDENLTFDQTIKVMTYFDTPN